MSPDQFFVVTVLGLTLVFFIWGYWRYDIVALLALLAVVAGGIVSPADAFSGFGHPAVITVAAVLVISGALQSSGLIAWIAAILGKTGDNAMLQIAVIATLVAALSAFMNNVGALALLLPVVLQTAQRTGQSPSALLMPLSFGSLLGGLCTLIGTPPNIIIANYRAESAGTPFSMFDFTPVGVAIAVTGVVFMAAVGWRLIPIRDGARRSDSNLFDIDEYIAELYVPPKSGLSGTPISELIGSVEEGDIVPVAIIRQGRKILRPRLSQTVRINDRILFEGSAENIEKILHKTTLKLPEKRVAEHVGSDDYGLMEAVVTPGSGLISRTSREAGLSRSHGMNLLAIARQGRPIREHLMQVRFRAGDVILVQGDLEAMPDAFARLSCLPLAQRSLGLHKGPSLWPLIIFAVALALGITGLLSIPVAFTGAVVALVLSKQVAVRDMYRDVDWSVIVLLAAMVPVGLAVEQSGTTSLIANAVAALSHTLPAWSIVVIVLVTAMVLSDVMNNAATAVLMAPLAAGIAGQMGVNADPMLMAVAVGSSCAFLTPIGHQSNILVMGPAGYRFGDYWRLGLPLELIIIAVAVPAILFFWPL